MSAQAPDPGAGVAPTPQDKAAFLRALAQGIDPYSEAARKLEEKKGGAFAAGETPRVEVLRRIPAQAPAPVVENTPASAQALALAADIETMLASGAVDQLQPHAQQALFSAMTRLYAASVERDGPFPIMARDAPVSATDVMTACGAMLKVVDLQAFELAMWLNWSSR